MQGKLLINKPGHIPCGLINATNNNHLNNHYQNHHHQQQQPQHLNNHLSHQQQQQQQHNGLTFSVSVNSVNNRLINNGRDHKKLDRSISEPVEKLILTTPSSKFLQTPNNQRQNGNQRSTSTTNTTSIVSVKNSNTSSGNTNNNTNSSSSSSTSSNSNSTSSSRYKTELCRPFEENGTCKYGDKCQFAHGYHELRNLQRHPRYKTVLCRTFHTVGFCPYGPRCHFIHNSEESKKNIIHTLQAGGPNQEKNCSDASNPSTLIFENISPPPPLILGGSAILNGAFVNSNTSNSTINNLLNNLTSTTTASTTATTGITGMRPKALSIGSCSLDGSSTSGDLSQPSTPPSGSPASLSSCFDQNDRLHFTPNSYDSSISGSNGSSNGDCGSAFTFALNRDSLSLCEQEFLSLSLSPRWSF